MADPERPCGYRTPEGEQLERLVVELDTSGRHAMVQALLVDADRRMTEGVAEAQTEVPDVPQDEGYELTTMERLDELEYEFDHVRVSLELKNRKRVLEGLAKIEKIIEIVRMDVQTDPTFDRRKKA